MRRILIPTAIAVFLSACPMFSADQALDSSENLFTMLAALNAAGYNTGIDLPDNSPLRAQLRQYLSQQSIPVLKDIRDFYVYKHPSIAPYISLALSLGAGPDFPYKVRDLDVPPDALALDKFIPLLQRFYLEAKVPELWKRVQPAFDAEIEKYHEPVSNITLLVNSYLRSTTAGYQGRHFQVYIDLLAAPDQVQSRSYGNDYYVVVTPAKEPNVFELRHTFLHFVIEPLASKYKAVIMQNSALSDYLAGAPVEDSYKNDFLLLTTESLIKAIESRLDRKPSLVTDALKEGFILTPFFAEALVAYEKQPTAMRLYFPEMMETLDPAKERHRIESVTFVAKPKQMVTVTAAEPPPPPLSPSGKALILGDAAYTKKDYEGARGYYLKALDLPGVGPDHAKAYYGLARLRLIERKPEEAEQLFQKTVASSPDPPTLAWAEVYLGRLWDSQGDREEATKHYQAALAVKGATDQAHKAAEKELQDPLTKPGKK